MVDHRSTGLPECGPTESSAPEPCYLYLLFTHSIAINIVPSGTPVYLNRADTEVQLGLC